MMGSSLVVASGGRSILMHPVATGTHAPHSRAHAAWRGRDGHALAAFPRGWQRGEGGA